VIAVPQKAVLFTGASLALDHQANGIGEALRRMRDMRRQ
jgi:hypothetical protein